MDPNFVSILACPTCRGPVTMNEDKTGLVCQACAVIYPIREDIPIMLVEEAKPCGAN